MTPGPSWPGLAARQKPALWSEIQTRPLGSTIAPADTCSPSEKIDELRYLGSTVMKPSGCSGASSGSTVNVKASDGRLVLPARSVAVISSVCSPPRSKCRVRPGWQGAKASSSSKRQAIDAPPSASKVNHGDALTG